LLLLLLYLVQLSGLSGWYPNYTAYNYVKTGGVCAENSYYNSSDEVSFSTCRYLCDRAQQRNKTCHFGFTYYHITPEDAQLGTTVSKCRLLIRNCSIL